MKRKAQAALEYLFMIALALAIVAMVVYTVKGTVKSAVKQVHRELKSVEAAFAG